MNFGTFGYKRNLATGFKLFGISAAIANGSVTAVKFQHDKFEINSAGQVVQSFDNGDFFDSSLRDRICIREEGLYLFTACVEWPSNATGFRYVYLTKAGKQFDFGVNNIIGFDTRTALNGSETNGSAQCIDYCLPGDTIHVQVYQSSGGSLTPGRDCRFYFAGVMMSPAIPRQ